MDENVLAAALRRDEAEAAIAFEEFQRSVLARTALTRLAVALKTTTATAAEASAAAAAATAIPATAAAFAIAAATIAAATTTATVAAATAAVSIAAATAAPVAAASAFTIAAEPAAGTTAAISAATISAATISVATATAAAGWRLGTKFSISTELSLTAAPRPPIAVTLLATITKLVVVAAVLAHNFQVLSRITKFCLSPTSYKRGSTGNGQVRTSSIHAVLGED